MDKDTQIESLKERNKALEQRVNELIDGNKCIKEELKLVMDSATIRAEKYQDRIKELEEQVEKLKKKQQETFKLFRATHKTKYELIKKLEETSGCH
jgi:cell division protein FtsB